jgi:hypothetical protein
MADNCFIPNCIICRDSRMLDAIAAKCTREERLYLTNLYCRMEAAVTEIEWRDRTGETTDMADGTGI